MSPKAPVYIKHLIVKIQNIPDGKLNEYCVFGTNCCNNIVIGDNTLEVSNCLFLSNDKNSFIMFITFTEGKGIRPDSLNKYFPFEKLDSSNNLVVDFNLAKKDSFFNSIIQCLHEGYALIGIPKY